MVIKSPPSVINSLVVIRKKTTTKKQEMLPATPSNEEEKGELLLAKLQWDGFFFLFYIKIIALLAFLCGTDCPTLLHK